MLVLILAVFGITLIITKSKILGGKREFVEKRYQASKNYKNNNPWIINFIHSVWRAIWTCPMCCGPWVAGILCLFYNENNWFLDVCILTGTNWLLHCLESLLFNVGKFFEKLNDSEEIL